MNSEPIIKLYVVLSCGRPFAFCKDKEEVVALLNSFIDDDYNTVSLYEIENISSLHRFIQLLQEFENDYGEHEVDINVLNRLQAQKRYRHQQHKNSF